MPEPIAVVSLIVAAAGVLITQVGTLVPARRDFMADLNLKRAVCQESIASKHFFLMKQFASFEDFDNLPRGDGVNAQDGFSEYAQELLVRVADSGLLSKLERSYRVSHLAVITSITVLVLVGLLVVASPEILSATVRAFAFAAGGVEIGSLFGLYYAGSRLEKVK